MYFKTKNTCLIGLVLRFSATKHVIANSISNTAILERFVSDKCINHGTGFILSHKGTWIFGWYLDYEMENMNGQIYIFVQVAWWTLGNTTTLLIFHQERRGQVNTIVMEHFNSILFHKSGPAIIVLYCIVLKGWSLLSNVLRSFQDLLCSPEFRYY